MQTNNELLIEAAANGNIEIMEELIKHGADVDFRGVDPKTLCPMDVAAANGHCDAISLLLRSGANVDGTRLSTKLNRLLSAREQRNFYENLAYDYTPLMRAIIGEHIEAMQILLIAGARVDATIFSNHSGTEINDVLSLTIQNHSINLEKSIAIIKLILPYADLISPFIRSRAIECAEHCTRKLPSGEIIPVTSGGKILSREHLENSFDWNIFHRKISIASLLRSFYTHQYRLEMINFDPTTLNAQSKECYESMIDPITLNIMNDPIKVSSGIFYDRQSLIDYFNSQINTERYYDYYKKLPCPLTRIIIGNEELYEIKPEDCIFKDKINKFITEQEAITKETTSHIGIFSSTQSAATDEQETDQPKFTK